MPTPENPVITEHQEEFKVPENLKSEITAIETNVKTNIQVDNHGQPVITRSDKQSLSLRDKIQLPDRATWLQKAKGSINDAITWLAKYLLRKDDKQKYANSND